VKIYYTTPLENDASRTVRLQSVTIPPGQGNQFHRHPGDQWAAVQEGEVTLTIKGQAPRTLKVGDSVHIPRGTVHRNQKHDRQASTLDRAQHLGQGQAGARAGDRVRSSS
jgi:quercetin dioxygenase-like cupin family protein